MANLNFVNACVFAQRIMVDYEDRGIVELLDMERILCHNDERHANGVLSVRECIDCGYASVEGDELSEEELETLVRWTTIGRFVPNGRIEDTEDAEPDGFEDGAERETFLRELFE